MGFTGGVGVKPDICVIVGFELIAVLERGMRGRALADGFWNQVRQRYLR